MEPCPNRNGFWSRHLSTTPFVSPAIAAQQAATVARFFEHLVNGDRVNARQVVRESLDSNTPPALLLNQLFFPVYEKIETLYRADQLTIVAYNLATRLLRTLIDQVAAALPQAPRNGKTLFAVCGPSQSEELAAQMAVDILEAAGCDVTFSGGGIPSDEVLAQVHERRPDMLLLFASAASDLPGIREIIDSLREIGAVDRTRIVVGGGVFNRAPGLAEEIRCDLWATTPLELVQVVLTGQLSDQAALESQSGTIARIGAKTKTQRRAAA